jgi:hypothetical protein
MAVFTSGNVSLNLGLLQMTGDFSDADRQCAWELYTELRTRGALLHHASSWKELMIEVFDSLYAFFQEARAIMKRFPVGQLGGGIYHLGFLIDDLLNNYLRPFLNEWQAIFRHWWEIDADQSLAPFERQQSYPAIDELLSDHIVLKAAMRETINMLIQAYNLTPMRHK